MPLYEYQCEDCGHRFERIRKFSDEPLRVCPACTGSVRKLVSSPAIQFKGSGWYVTDYARKPEGKPASDGEGKADKQETKEKKDQAAPAADSKSAAAKKTGSASPAASPPSPSAG